MDEVNGDPMASHLVYDDKIGQEIIEGDTDLTKEIFVESGTTIDELRDPHSNGGLDVLDDDVVCTTMTVIIAASVGIVLLQISILTTCILCLYLSRSSKPSGSHDDRMSSHRTTTSLPSYRTSTPVCHDNYGFR